MFNAIKQGVVHSLQQPPPDIEALRVYLLLPEFSIYQKEEQYDAIVIPFGEAILRLSVDAGKVLSEYEEPYAPFAPTKYIEDITRWREDMNFIFEWQKNILRTSAGSEYNIVFATIT